MTLACAATAFVRLTAHEIPRDVIIHMFVKPDGDRLRVAARVPLGAMRDIPFPQRADGTLDAKAAQPLLRDAVAQWVLTSLDIRENGETLRTPSLTAVRVSLPSDRSFGTFETAAARIGAGQVDDPALPWDQASLDMLIEYPIRSASSRFAIRPGFERLGVSVMTSLRVVTPEGRVRPFEFRGDPGLVHLDPRWHEAARRFVAGGFTHILDGVDHLLFLVCLVIPFRRLRPLLIVVTAFTAAHSVALVAAAWGFVPDALWFPPLVETLIAASVLYMALENIVAPANAQRRAWMAFGFGLIHGFGFSFALSDTLQFAGSHLAMSLLSFNAGVELGQIAVLLVLVPALSALFRYGLPERIGTIVLSALAGHVAWHWMAERWDAFRQFPLPAPGLELALFIVRVAIVLLAAGAGLRLLQRTRRDIAETS